MQGSDAGDKRRRSTVCSCGSRRPAQDDGGQTRASDNLGEGPCRGHARRTSLCGRTPRLPAPRPQLEEVAKSVHPRTVDGLWDTPSATRPEPPSPLPGEGSSTGPRSSCSGSSLLARPGHRRRARAPTAGTRPHASTRASRGRQRRAESGHPAPEGGRKCLLNGHQRRAAQAPRLAARPPAPAPRQPGHTTRTTRRGCGEGGEC